ncbi:MAG: hypothetical protein ACOCWM_04910 [Cyclobacteriaceae bacterium]
MKSLDKTFIRIAKVIISKNNPLYKFSKNIYHDPQNRIWRPNKTKSEVQILEKLSLLNKEMYFIQVGSHDGKTYDPLYPFVSRSTSWKGIMVEPLPDMFLKLRENYKNRDDIIFENCAIFRKSGFGRLYELQEKKVGELPAWYKQVTSLGRNHLLKCRKKF